MSAVTRLLRFGWSPPSSDFFTGGDNEFPVPTSSCPRRAYGPHIASFEGVDLDAIQSMQKVPVQSVIVSPVDGANVGGTRTGRTTGRTSEDDSLGGFSDFSAGRHVEDDFGPAVPLKVGGLIGWGRGAGTCVVAEWSFGAVRRQCTSRGVDRR